MTKQLKSPADTKAAEQAFTIVAYMSVDGHICAKCQANPEWDAADATPIAMKDFVYDEEEECGYRGGRLCHYCGDTLADCDELSLNDRAYENWVADCGGN